MFKVTREWLRKHSRNGVSGWNKEQVKIILGYDWPPLKGWLLYATFMEISDEDKARFEALAGQSQEGIKIDKGRANMATNPVYHSWPDGKGGWYGEWMSGARPPWNTDFNSKGRIHSPKAK